MSISQPRMLALIAAAENYRNAFKLTQRNIAEAKAQIEAGADPIEAITWAQLASATELMVSEETTETFAAEKAHFSRSTVRRNDRLTLKRAIQRSGIRDPEHLAALREQRIVEPTQPTHQLLTEKELLFRAQQSPRLKPTTPGLTTSRTLNQPINKALASIKVPDIDESDPDWQAFKAKRELAAKVEQVNSEMLAAPPAPPPKKHTPAQELADRLEREEAESMDMTVEEFRAAQRTGGL